MLYKPYYITLSLCVLTDVTYELDSLRVSTLRYHIESLKINRNIEKVRKDKRFDNFVGIVVLSKHVKEPF